MDKRDDHGREPLFAGRQGRQSEATLRGWAYLGTQPCLYMTCPHGKDRDTCKFRQRDHASKCPSSRSPHQVRTGSATWHRDQGIPLEVASGRLDMSPDVLKQYYDKASGLERMEKRRSEFTADLDIEDSTEDADNDDTTDS